LITSARNRRRTAPVWASLPAATARELPARHESLSLDEGTSFFALARLGTASYTLGEKTFSALLLFTVEARKSWRIGGP
jgi:hypothetical protein